MLSWTWMGVFKGMDFVLSSLPYSRRLTVLAWSVLVRARRTCNAVQSRLAGAEQLRGPEAELGAAAHPVELRHLHQGRHSGRSMGEVHDLRRGAEEVPQQLLAIWHCLRGGCPSDLGSHRRGLRQGQSHQVGTVLYLYTFSGLGYQY